ncbi:MAG: prepilin peptidase [Rubrobacter sp.]|nr:prepilin peptidase [Rubrobacter sp.]
MTLVAAVLALFGLVIGSFLNVVIHRVPLGESVVWPSSRCPECGAAISPRDNVPVLSYLLLAGRCRSCKTAISARYPAVEASTGLLFGAAAYRFGLGVELLAALVLISVLITLSGTDLEYRLLPNVIVVPAALAGFGLSVLAQPSAWWVYLLSALAVGGGLLALALLYPSGMGMGDVKMGAMLGTFLGPYAALAVFLGALAGALASGGLMLAGKLRRRSALPFGVFLALGGLVVLFAGAELWGLYLRTMGVG